MREIVLKNIKSMMLPERCISTFTLSESISVLMNLKLYFGMSSIFFIFFRVVVGKKLSILLFSIGLSVLMNLKLLV